MTCTVLRSAHCGTVHCMWRWRISKLWGWRVKICCNPRLYLCLLSTTCLNGRINHPCFRAVFKFDEKCQEYLQIPLPNLLSDHDFMPQLRCYGLCRHLRRDYISHLIWITIRNLLVKETALASTSFFKSMYLLGLALNVVQNLLMLKSYCGENQPPFIPPGRIQRTNSS